MEWKLTERQGEICISLAAMVQGRDGVFWIYGGTRPHIGAVAVELGGKTEQLTVFPGHREELVVRALEERLARCEWLEHVIVCAGIHYDDIRREWIPQILALCERLADRMVDCLNVMKPEERGGLGWSGKES